MADEEEKPKPYYGTKRLYPYCPNCGAMLGPHAKDITPHQCAEPEVFQSPLCHKTAGCIKLDQHDGDCDIIRIVHSDTSMLLLQEIQAVSIQRALRWHNGDLKDWSVLEWSGAMAGEAGEACNFAKKIKRTELNYVSHNTPPDVLEKYVREVADTFLYSVLCFARVGYIGQKMDDIIRAVFNAKSEEYGFPERL